MRDSKEIFALADKQRIFAKEALKDLLVRAVPSYNDYALTDKLISDFVDATVSVSVLEVAATTAKVHEKHRS